MRINCEIFDLRAFLAIVDLGSFHKAAEALNISQPALSRRIRALEEALSVQLLDRSTRHVDLSSEGRALEPMIRRMLEDFELAVEEVSGVGRPRGGQITIACVPTAAFYFLPRVISAFHKVYPGMRFRILDLSADPALDAVARNEADFGVNFLGASRHDLRFTPLLEDPFVLACRKDHPFARRRKIKWSDLEDMPLIGVSRTSGNRMLLDAALGKIEIRPNWLYEVNHLSMSLGLVEAGLGMSILPRLATPQGDHPLIVSKPIGDPQISRTIGLVERTAGQMSPAAQQLRNMLVESWRG